MEVSSFPSPRDRNGQFEFLSNGEKREADWAETNPQTFSILLNGRSYNVRLENVKASDDTGGPAYTVHVGAQVHRIAMRDPRRLRRRGAGGPHDGPQEIVAPMPGRIVKVLAAAGQQVKAGESLMVIEAMKMQNEIRAPRDALVEMIRVSEGDGVESGALLLRLA
ncbi:MAG TPA: biotin/lipoyl-containing protein [Terriglobia bacterium]|nr:biotin/lipoyl-containing protein [Terriglobia bacterium]